MGAGDDKILLTIFLKHDQSQNLHEIQGKLADRAWWERFPPKGVEIVSTKGRAADSDRQYSARDNNDFSVHPMVLLIDNGSASASEILAGALQDHDRALIVGETSWGKGLVQSLFSLDDGYFLKLTTARYYTPSGRSIQRDDEIELASSVGLPSEAGALETGTDFDAGAWAELEAGYAAPGSARLGSK